MPVYIKYTVGVISALFYTLLWYNDFKYLRRNISNPCGLLDRLAPQGLQIDFARLFVCKHPTDLQIRFDGFSPL